MLPAGTVNLLSGEFNQHHNGYVVVADARGANMDLLIKRHFPILEKRHNERDSEGNHHGSDIETHLVFNRPDVFEPDPIPEINHQENDNWQQRDEVRLRPVTVSFLCQILIILISVHPMIPPIIQL